MQIFPPFVLPQQSEQVNQADVALGPRTAPLCVVDWIEKYAQVRSIRDQFDFSSVANVRCGSVCVIRVLSDLTDDAAVCLGAPGVDGTL